MKKEKKQAAGASNLAWHPAFLQAIRLELSEYRDTLEFKYEYQLTAEPLRIDVLIIKKPKELEIEKNIARIFRTDNILDYKSPGDYLSVKSFFKTYAYANLYAAITEGVDLSDVTITFVERKYPRELMKYLVKTRGYIVKETSAGIYIVTGDYIPIQIIETKKLPESGNIWLKSLTNDLETRNLRAILEKGKKREGGMPSDAYFDVILRANKKILMEVSAMTTPTLEEILTEAGVLPVWVAKWEVKSKTEVARNLIAKGMSIEEIAQVTELPYENVLALGGGIADNQSVPC